MTYKRKENENKENILVDNKTHMKIRRNMYEK